MFFQDFKYQDFSAVSIARRGRKVIRTALKAQNKG